MSHRRKQTAALMIAVMICTILSGCGSKGESPSELLKQKSDQFGQGKEEITYIAHEDPRELLAEMIEKYSGSRVEPEPMEEEQAEIIVEEVQEERKKQEEDTGATVEIKPFEVRSDDDLVAVYSDMLDHLEKHADIKLADGYQMPDRETMNRIADRVSRENVVTGSFIDCYYWAPDYLLLDYDLPADEITAIREETSELVRQAVSDIGNPGETDVEIVCTVNHYLCDHNEYPPEDMNQYPGSMEGFSHESHSAWGLFKEQSAVCEGYARACKLLLDEYGVDNIIIFGEGGGEAHAWNMIRVEGAWYHTDVCWNDGSGQEQEFLLISDQDIQAKEHTWDSSEYPASAVQSYSF